LDVNIINDLIKKAKQNKLDLNIEFLTLNKRKEEIDNENGEVEKRISKLEEINNIKNNT